MLCRHHAMFLPVFPSLILYVFGQVAHYTAENQAIRVRLHNVVAFTLVLAKTCYYQLAYWFAGSLRAPLRLGEGGGGHGRLRKRRGHRSRTQLRRGCGVVKASKCSSLFPLSARFESERTRKQ